jgi:hypothetical protein
MLCDTTIRPGAVRAATPALTTPAKGLLYMADRDIPSIECLRQRLKYDPETGAIVCVKTGRARMGNLSTAGYLRGKVKGKVLYAHRVAWALHHGAWPEHSIDHINRDKTDNRIVNLRDVLHAENMKNKSVYRSNTSGATGVSFHKHSKLWMAYAGPKGSATYHKTFEDALNARHQSERGFGFSENHGKAPRDAA